MGVFLNKKVRHAVLCVLTLCLIVSPVMRLDIYADSAIGIEMNGKELFVPVDPVIINDRTMVPMRAIFEAFGMKVDWNSETQTITSFKSGYNVVMKIGSTSMNVNGKDVAMDVAPLITGGSTLVPLRAISETLGASVAWDESRRVVMIKTTQEEYSRALLPDRAYATFDNDKVIKCLEFIPMASYDESKIPSDIGYVVTGLQYTNEDPETLKTAPLKAGDRFAVYRPQYNHQGLYIYQIPNNAVAIHPSGDMRYGWVDYSIAQDVIDFMNVLREIENKENPSGGRTPLMLNSSLRNYDNGSGSTVAGFHYKSVYDAGIQPWDFGLNYVGSLDYHYPQAIEVLSYGGLEYWRVADDSVSYDISLGMLLMTLTDSPSHYGIMTNASNKSADVILIMRPDMNAKLVINLSSSSN